MIIVHACTMIIVHASTMVMVHACGMMIGLMVGVVKDGGSGGRSLPVKQGGLGGRQAPQLSENSVSQFSAICYYLLIFTNIDDCYDYERLPVVRI